ncbi:very long-chain specific acyl-CoA dehydrogenase, mitochondrial [Harpegnathos saltator]|uniref:Very long-chain specific acyl-CoA dehydrogenase, mitochondrial n=1 Tax=Harpegnathos saltator TaxID=610380 RepID=E2BYV9_HARSA|nr:very long-chain specific acyl-CoA dehydrogenase, mitochondrial [Harpegnathos saltator]XP_025154682.1 very long-chain specific acyl-CoA dehydrogenase, mitochondrial [Harpegnathos saltator]EFN79131.1 Very long-chain specific acyl-CoA dehydrogenase, mitochondrial [Harpegnathos saltator]
MFRIARVFSASRNVNKALETSLGSWNAPRCLATQAAVKATPVENSQENATVKESQSFTMNIFRNQLQLDQVFPFPDPMTEEQIDTVKMLIDPMEKFYEEINDPAKNDQNAAIDEKTATALWELGAFGLQVPQEYGGLGLTNTQYSRCVEICGYHDLGVGITLGAHQSIGFKGILLFGTPEQKAKYLPRVCNGEYAAFCLTEPSSGSDASSIRCRAVKAADGSHYILNGSKIWISNGGIANIMTVFAQVPTKDPNTGEMKNKMTAFIVERGFGGVTSGPPEKKMGIRCSNTAEIFFEDVKIPAENVLGKEGQGFKVAMNILNNGRFGMAAALSGNMRYCISRAVSHATQRVQFGRTLDNYGTIQEKIARMAMLHYITESLAYMISGNMDRGSQDYHLEAAISKCFSSESAWWVCDEAIQTLGGMGYMRDAGLERVLRDLRIFRIFEGANDILRLFIALTGIQYAGSHLKELQKAFKNPGANVGLLFGEATKRATRAIGLSSPPTFTHLVHPKLAESAALCSKSVESFGNTIEASLIKYGRGIVEEQFILNRLTQAAFDTYTMAVILSRATRSLNKNLPSAEHELLMTQAWCAEASNRAAYNLQQVNSGKQLDFFSKLGKISKNVFDVGGCVQLNPLGF